MLAAIKRNKFKSTFFILILLVASTVAYISLTYRVAPLSWGMYGEVNAPSGVALDGHDVVAYHIANTAQKGKAELYTTWKNTKWYFSSEKNKKLFNANPELFAPQFGANCATAVSEGLTAAVDGKSYMIKDGKLYMFYDDAPKQDFIAQLDNNIIQRSEANWGSR